MVNTLGYETISQAIMMMNIDPRLRFRKAFSLSRFKVGDTGRHRFEFFNDPGSADELASTMIFLGYFKDSNEAVDFIDDQTGQSMRLAAPLGRHSVTTAEDGTETRTISYEADINFFLNQLQLLPFNMVMDSSVFPTNLASIEPAEAPAPPPAAAAPQEDTKSVQRLGNIKVNSKVFDILQGLDPSKMPKIEVSSAFCHATNSIMLASMFFDDDHNVYYTPFAFRLQDTILNRLCYTKFEQFKVAYDLSTFLKDGMFERDTVEESKRSETTFNTLLWRAVANDSGVNGYATHLTNDSDRVDPFEALNIDATDNLFFQLDYVLTSLFPHYITLYDDDDKPLPKSEQTKYYKAELLKSRLNMGGWQTSLGYCLHQVMADKSELDQQAGDYYYSLLMKLVRSPDSVIDIGKYFVGIWIDLLNYINGYIRKHTPQLALSSSRVLDLLVMLFRNSTFKYSDIENKDYSTSDYIIGLTRLKSKIDDLGVIEVEDTDKLHAARINLPLVGNYDDPNDLKIELLRLLNDSFDKTSSGSMPKVMREFDTIKTPHYGISLWRTDIDSRLAHVNLLQDHPFHMHLQYQQLQDDPGFFLTKPEEICEPACIDQLKDNNMLIVDGDIGELIEIHAQVADALEGTDDDVILAMRENNKTASKQPSRPSTPTGDRLKMLQGKGSMFSPKGSNPLSVSELVRSGKRTLQHLADKGQPPLSSSRRQSLSNARKPKGRVSEDDKRQIQQRHQRAGELGQRTTLHNPQLSTRPDRDVRPFLSANAKARNEQPGSIVGKSKMFSGGNHKFGSPSATDKLKRWAGYINDIVGNPKSVFSDQDDKKLLGIAKQLIKLADMDPAKANNKKVAFNLCGMDFECRDVHQLQEAFEQVDMCIDDYFVERDVDEGFYDRAASYITRARPSEAWPAPVSTRGRGRPTVPNSRGDAKPSAQRAHDGEAAHFNDGNDDDGFSSVHSGSEIDAAGSAQSSNSDITDFS